MTKYWLFEMDIFVEGEEQGVSVSQVIEHNSDFPPFHKVYEFISCDCPVPINISFKLAKQIDKDCFDYFNSVLNKEHVIE